MSAVTASLCSTLLFVLFVSADQKNITAESGQDVTLTCRAANNNIRLVKWSRADLGHEYVLMYRDGMFDPEYQHPSFKNRVDLQDRQMKDGDASLILKDVTINDEGRYVCRVGVEREFFWKLISIIDLAVVPPDPKIITAEPGQDVNLTCRAANNNIIAVKWSRADLGDEYVLLYQDGMFEPDDQHPSFKNRVDLQDRQMKDGDASLILKDVTINDTGRYECRVFMEREFFWKLISIIDLAVDPPGQTAGDTEDGGKEDGSVGLIIGLIIVIFIVIVVGVSIFLIRRKDKPHKKVETTYHQVNPDDTVNLDDTDSHLHSQTCQSDDLGTETSRRL